MAFPLKTIIAWDSTIIPEGWAVCNGQTVGSIVTPDLRNRFIRGASDDTDVNTVGGVATHAHAYPAVAAEVKADHTHGANPTVASSGVDANKAPSGSGMDPRAASHNHSVGGYLNPAGAHSHGMADTQPASNDPAYISLLFIMKVVA